MHTADGELLTLQEAADRLKVHYMTAYRWVRRGELPAYKAGRRLRIRAGDLDRFVRDREVDVGLPAGEVRRTNWPVHVDRLSALLRDGKGVEASNAVRKIVADGAPAGDVYLRLIAPALHRVGDEWAAGRITVAVEHRATEIAHALMARLSDHFRRRGPSRGTALTMTPPGDHHGLAAAMVADFLRAGGYDVHHLGPNVPIEDLGLFLQIVPTDVVCVSMTNAGAGRALYAAIVEAAGGTGGALVVFGGQGADPNLAEDVGAGHVADLAALNSRLDVLARP
jgi:excisionase family DNA binding protein